MTNPDFKQIINDAGIPTTEGEIRTQWQSEVDASGYTNTSDYSPVWRLISALIIKPALLLVNALITTVLPQSFLKTASGSVVDIMAWGVGLDRKLQARASGHMLFERQSAASALVIPVGSVVQSPLINGESFLLLTTATVEFSVGETRVLVPVLAEGYGSRYNLSEGFYSILREPISGVSVKNPRDWLTVPGADIELDADLKDRVRNQFSAVNQYHTDAVYTSIITSISGISPSEVFFESNAPRGPGTANAYILLSTGEPGAEFIALIQDEITTKGNHGHGDDLQVFAMPSTQHNINASIHLVYGLTAIQKNQIVIDVEQFIRAAFRDNKSYVATLTKPNSRFSFSKLSNELHQQFNDIDSIEFDNSDIISVMSVPRINTINVGLADGN